MGCCERAGAARLLQHDAHQGQARGAAERAGHRLVPHARRGRAVLRRWSRPPVGRQLAPCTRHERIQRDPAPAGRAADQQVAAGARLGVIAVSGVWDTIRCLPPLQTSPLPRSRSPWVAGRRQALAHAEPGRSTHASGRATQPSPQAAGLRRGGRRGGGSAGGRGRGAAEAGAPDITRGILRRVAQASSVVLQRHCHRRRRRRYRCRCCRCCRGGAARGRGRGGGAGVGGERRQDARGVGRAGGAAGERYRLGLAAAGRPWHPVQCRRADLGLRGLLP